MSAIKHMNGDEKCKIVRNVFLWVLMLGSVFIAGYFSKEWIFRKHRNNDIKLYNISTPLPNTKNTSKAVSSISLLHYFSVNDVLDITWAHGANNKSQMGAALNNKDIMMLEVDILLQGQGTANQTNLPIMAHPPDIYSDNTFEEWLTKVLESDKGMKLDFKSIDAVGPALDILNSNKEHIHQPIWLNADILVGINTNMPGRNASEFLQLVNEKFPECTLSLGWTTAWTNSVNDTGYTTQMVEEMANLVQTLSQPITFPVRAAAVKQSWDKLKWLLCRNSEYTLTIWSGKYDQVNPDDMVFVRNNTSPIQVYYDLPEPLNSRFRTKVQELDNKQAKSSL